MDPARNDGTQYRHPELDSGSRVWITDQVRNDGGVGLRVKPAMTNKARNDK